jgi:pyruvate dehydrogenase E2 component (dihydrolipoamide acetyltransferase)
MTTQEQQNNDHIVPMGRIQKIIGQRMSRSKQNIPCFYLKRRADISELLDMRRGAGRDKAVKITTNDFLIRALGLAIEKYPLLAAKIDNNDIVIADTVNVGFAVAAPHGLVVPVIKDAQKKHVAQIATETEALTQKARSDQLTADDVGGACITLSNLGVFGIDSFIAIVSPGQASVMAVGNIAKSPIRTADGTQVRRQIDMTLSVDHTIVNGDYAARFLSFAAELLEQPQRLI